MPHSAQSSAAAPLGAVPLRTCTGCGKRSPRSELLRIVANRGSIRMDPLRNLPGRGAWIHADPACIARARGRRSLERSLRRADAIQDDLWAALEEMAMKVASQMPENE